MARMIVLFHGKNDITSIRKKIHVNQIAPENGCPPQSKDQQIRAPECLIYINEKGERMALSLSSLSLLSLSLSLRTEIYSRK